MFETDSERFVAAQLARSSLFFFSRYMMLRTRGLKWQRAPHHKTICDAFTRVFEGKCKRLILNLPPRYSKTQLALSFVNWSQGKAPDSEYIFTSYSGRLAATNSWQAREAAKSEVYREIFPEVQIDETSSARDEWRTMQGGCVYATGSGGSVTGYGAGKFREQFGGAIIIDDALKSDDARSDTIRGNVIEWFQNTLQSRCNSPETPIIVIGQRLHEEDLPGWLLAGGNGEEWESVILPAITERGEALWPEKHTLDDLRRMERASPYVFAGQYLQRPAPLLGGIFKPDNLVIVEQAPKCIQFERAWDLAASRNEGDYTAGALLGRTQTGRYVILDVVTLQGSPDEVEAKIVATAKLDGQKVRVNLPQDPGQAGKAQVAYFTKALSGHRVISSPESGDKVTRAEPFAAQVNVGNVDMVRADWNLGLVNEMRNFPNAKHDDQVDAMSRAFMTLAGARGPMQISDEVLRMASGRR